MNTELTHTPVSPRCLALIPARYASTRFPGKPLAMLDGKTIIRRVYERVAHVFDQVYVATDDKRIADEVGSFGGKYVMTGQHHKSGTDRCYEALTHLGADQYDVVVNVQGDEPFVAESQLRSVIGLFADPATEIATLVKPFTTGQKWEELANPNTPKVVLGDDGRALYFSRSVIPYLRGVEMSQWLTRHTFYKHIGLYAYRAEVLKRITTLPQSSLELAESLEQLRWLQAGIQIRVATTDTETIGIDTPEDLRRAENWLHQNISSC